MYLGGHNDLITGFVSDRLLRLSVGIEVVDDLMGDLEEALKTLVLFQSTLYWKRMKHPMMTSIASGCFFFCSIENLNQTLNNITMIF